jgi:hypothetical protein
MVTIQQQIEFVDHVRNSYDDQQRQRILVSYPPEMVAELLKAIHENLIGVRNWQLGQEVKLCIKCNQPLGDDANCVKICTQCIAEIEFNAFFQNDTLI